MSEMIVRESSAMESIVTALEQINRKQSEELMQMALQMRSMLEIITKLEKEVRSLEKITPMQVTELNALLRKRGKELCDEYGLEGRETKVNALIRAAVKREFGIGGIKELCRNDFTLCRTIITMWEDSAKLFALRRD